MNKNSSLSSKQTKNENLKGSFGKKVRFALACTRISFMLRNLQIRLLYLPVCPQTLCGSTPHRNTVSLLFRDVHKDVIL